MKAKVKRMNRYKWRTRRRAVRSNVELAGFFNGDVRVVRAELVVASRTGSSTLARLAGSANYQRLTNIAHHMR
jgi:hypothetical protein